MQEQVEIKLPVTGKTVVLRGYITGRIEQAIQNVYLENSKIGTEAEIDTAGSQDRKRPDKVKQTTTMDATVGQLAGNKAIELIVISIDGNTDNIVDQVLDLPKQDYQAVVDKVEEISNPKVDGSES